MAIYFANLLSIPFWYMVMKYFLRLKKCEENVVNVVCIQLIFILGLRAINIGVDTQQYEQIFIIAGRLSFPQIFNYYMEPFYLLINKVVAMMGLGYNAVLFVNASITIFGIRSFVLGQSNDKIMSLWLLITIGYFSSMMNIMRQFVALTFVLNAYQCMVNKERWYKFAINGMVAFFMHKSSILLFLVLLFYKLLYSKKKAFSLLLKIGAIIAAVVGIFILNPILQTLSSMGLIGYEYLKTGAAYEYSILNFNFLLKLLCVVACFIIEKKGRRLSETDKERFRLFKYVMIVSCFMNILSVEFNMFTRLNIYFSFALIVLVPNIIFYFPIKNKKLIVAVVYIATAIMYITDLISEGNAIVPYATYLMK